MMLGHLTSLVLALAPLIAASTSTGAATPASSTLPVALQHGIPICAQSCFQVSLVGTFPEECTAPEDIECLCSHYGNKGVSLGEVALSCVFSSCSASDANQYAGSAYNICLGQKNAVAPTQTALTVPANTAMSATSSSSNTATRISTTLPTQTPSTQAASVDLVSVIPPPTSTLTSPSTAPATASGSPPKMSPAQIAGLSVAAVAAFILALGLMALSVCLRKRKERKFVQYSNEKQDPGQFKRYTGRISHYVPGESAAATLARLKRNRFDRHHANSPDRHLAEQGILPVIQRPAFVHSKSSSDSSLPRSQIGLAISAELDGVRTASAKTSNTLLRPLNLNNNTSGRSINSTIRDTIFEEDEPPPQRTSSILLPTPPAPIAPIRDLKPSRQRPPMNTNGRPVRRSELFLSIPAGHERPKPQRIIAAEPPSSGAHHSPEAGQGDRLAPPIQLAPSASSESKATTASSREPSNNGDILDYYLSTHEVPSPQVGPAQITRPKESPKTIQIRPKKSLSIISQAISPVSSSNYRDSLSSQTSFETADPNDPTPEDEDDEKQLSDDNQHVSPLEKSPISNLTYPKIPRASNQLVPRSPRKFQNYRSPSQRQIARSPFQPAALLEKRQHHLPPLLLETRPHLKSSREGQFRSPPRMPRNHVRSISLESWTSTPVSKIERQSKVQSGLWEQSAILYEEDMVRPLNVRRRERDGEMGQVNVGRDVRFQNVANDGLKSPAWVPRLTPTRKGEDLFISVGWSGHDIV